MQPFRSFSFLILCGFSILSFASTKVAWGHDEVRSSFQEAEKVIVKIANPLPKQIKLNKLDASVFFVNTTSDSLITLAISFEKRKVHCSSPNMKWSKEDRVLRSSEAISPKDFAVMCFPDSGTYNVSIYGLNKDGSASITKVIVP